MLETSQIAAADILARRAQEFLDELNDGDFDRCMTAYSNLTAAIETYAEMRVDCAVLDPPTQDPQRMTCADWEPAPSTKRVT